MKGSSGKNDQGGNLFQTKSPQLKITRNKKRLWFQVKMTKEAPFDPCVSTPCPSQFDTKAGLCSNPIDNLVNLWIIHVLLVIKYETRVDS